MYCMLSKYPVVNVHDTSRLLDISLFFLRYCYFDDEYDDVYVMRPFPSMWNCRVVHPCGLDPFTGDVRSLPGFCRSLEILTHLRSETSRLGIMSGESFSTCLLRPTHTDRMRFGNGARFFSFQKQIHNCSPYRINFLGLLYALS
jgi:hypothetical protein